MDKKIDKKERIKNNVYKIMNKKREKKWTKKRIKIID